MRLEYDITADDFAAIGRALAHADPSVPAQVRRFRRITVGLSAAFVLAGIFAAGLNVEVVRGWGLGCSMVMVGVAAITLWTSEQTAHDQREQAARALADLPAGRGALGRRTLTADAGGLTSEARFVTSRYQWVGLTDLFVSDGVLFLQFPGPLNLGIPPHAFRDENDRGRFAEQVRTWALAAGGSVGPEDDG